MKKLISVILSLILSLSLCHAALAQDKIGILMPTRDMQRWNMDGDAMKASLEAAGFTALLLYAENDAALQIKQIEQMITEGARAIIVAAVDTGALSDALNKAKEKNIPVIAYDRLPANTANVDYFATFDSYQVGAMQGQYIIDALHLNSAERVYTVEFTAGSPDDGNALPVFSGAYDALKPYIDSGALVCLSGQSDFAAAATDKWSGDAAKARMDGILSSFYADGKTLDICLCANDSTALGVTNSLLAFGLTKENFPLVTGQDCDTENVKNIKNGLQAMSVFKDTRALADRAAQMVVDLLSGKTPETNAAYDNGAVSVPAYNCDIACADAQSIEQVLIDSGYYAADDIK